MKSGHKGDLIGFSDFPKKKSEYLFTKKNIFLTLLISPKKVFVQFKSLNDINKH